MVLVIAALLLYPPLVAYHCLGLESIFNFFCQDTFYYISVANSSTTGFYTFDGELPVNGFHPLWQVLLTALFNAHGGSDQVTQLLTVFMLSVQLTVLGYCLGGLAVYNITGSRILGIMIILGVVYFLCLFSIHRAFDSPWNAMNGMESCLSLLFGGTLLCLFSAALSEHRHFLARGWFYWLIGINLSLIVMARLDDIFLVVAFCLCYLTLRRQAFGDNARMALIVASPTIVFLICYLVFNYWSVGTLLPISGVTKGGFALEDNLSQLVGLLTTGAVPEGAGIHYGTRVLVHALMWFPLLLSILFFKLVRVAKIPSEDNEEELFLTALLVYVCLKAFYNLIYVHANYQGNWYFMLSGLSLSFVALVLLSRFFSDMTGKVGHAKWYLGLFLGILVILHVVFSSHVFMRRGNKIYTFWKDARVVASELRAEHPGVKLVEFDDGFIGYSLNIPAIHGMGFLLDYQGYLAWRRGRLLEYCHHRGFDTIASMQYIRPGRKSVSSDELRTILNVYELRSENLGDYTFEVVFFHQATGTSFIRFRPKGVGAEKSG